jgi:CubicO group peptidase (beta-lactamase class C family)
MRASRDIVVSVLVCLLATFASTASTTTASDAIFPDGPWPTATPQEAHLDARLLENARDYALGGEGSGIILRGGRRVFAWGDQKQRYDLKSSTKSFGSIALGLAIGDGKVTLDDPAVRHQPTLGVPPEENKATGWIDKITLYHLATQTAGFEKPGGYGRLLFAPGSKWRYSDAGPNWLAECLTLVYQRDLNDLMFERVFGPIGIKPADLVWRKNQYREKTIGNGIARREFGAGISANVEAMSRIGHLMLRDGRWKDRQIIPADYVHQAGRPQSNVADLPIAEGDEHAGAPAHYGLLWWNNGDGTIAGVPRDTYWSWGLYDSLIVVMPSYDMVVVRAGKSWKRDKDGAPYDVLKPFLCPIAAAVQDKPAGKPKLRSQAAVNPSPYPPSPLLRGIELDWSSHQRAAQGMWCAGGSWLRSVRNEQDGNANEPCALGANR